MERAASVLSLCEKESAKNKKASSRARETDEEREEE